jgi:hypothetical protein
MGRLSVYLRLGLRPTVHSQTWRNHAYFALSIGELRDTRTLTTRYLGEKKPGDVPGFLLSSE